jgi:hypothetical protein
MSAWPAEVVSWVALCRSLGACTDQAYRKPPETKSGDAAAMPISASDRRVNDRDVDGFPGATSVFTGVLTNSYYVCMSEASRIVQGKLDPIGRHHDAFFEANRDITQLGCGDDTACRKAVHEPTRLNPVVVSPSGLSDDTTESTCSDVLARRSRLFDDMPYVFPGSGC